VSELHERGDCKNFCWCFSSARCLIKVTIETDQRQVVLLSHEVLVGIVKIEIESFDDVHLTLGIHGTEANETHRSIDERILDKAAQPFPMV